MKQKIKKGKVIQNCLKVTAAVIVASVVGFQFHEIINLNSQLKTLTSEHKKAVQELQIANKNMVTTNQLADILTTERDVCLEEKTTLEAEISKLQNENVKLKTSVREKDDKISELKKQVSARTVSKTSGTKTPSVAMDNANSGVVKATYTMSASAYTTASNGDPNVSEKWGNLTASGTTVKQGRTIAVDKNLIPLGTKVRLTFPSGWEQYNGTYIAEDTGNYIVGNRIDVYFDSYNTCIQFGKRTVKLEVLG